MWVVVIGTTVLFGCSSCGHETARRRDLSPSRQPTNLRVDCRCRVRRLAPDEGAVSRTSARKVSLVEEREHGQHPPVGVGGVGELRVPEDVRRVFLDGPFGDDQARRDALDGGHDVGDQANPILEQLADTPRRYWRAVGPRVQQTLRHHPSRHPLGPAADPARRTSRRRRTLPSQRAHLYYRIALGSGLAWRTANDGDDGAFARGEQLGTATAAGLDPRCPGCG